MNTLHQHTEEALRTILTTLGVDVTTITKVEDDKMKTVCFAVETPDSRMLIGENGARLQALNYVVKKIIEHKRDKGEIPADAKLGIMVDVNNYQGKRIEELRTKAGMLAERARYFRTSMPMEPMSAYERLIVHAEFTDAPDIRTESSGKGEDRHVVLYFDDTKTALS